MIAQLSIFQKKWWDPGCSKVILSCQNFRLLVVNSKQFAAIDTKLAPVIAYYLKRWKNLNTFISTVWLRRLFSSRLLVATYLLNRFLRFSHFTSARTLIILPRYEHKVFPNSHRKDYCIGAKIAELFFSRITKQDWLIKSEISFWRLRFL